VNDFTRVGHIFSDGNLGNDLALQLLRLVEHLVDRNFRNSDFLSNAIPEASPVVSEDVQPSCNHELRFVACVPGNVVGFNEVEVGSSFRHEDGGSSCEIEPSNRRHIDLPLPGG